MRLMNSGLNVRFTSPSTMSVTLLAISPVSDDWNPIELFFWMKRAPMFDVMMMIVFLKFTRFPRPSVRWPSSNTCSRMLKMSGCAFSISSSSTTRVRVALHLLGELAALFVPDVSGRRADQLADRVLLHVLGHVEADQRVVAAEQEIRQRARELGLADAGRPEEHEAADGTRRVLQPGARAADGARDRRDRLLLADDAAVQLRLPCAAACRPRPG